ncbi:hypothetical protein ACFLQK_02880, partial [bacterium]
MRNLFAISLPVILAAAICGCGGGGTRGNPIAPMPVAQSALTIQGMAKVPAGVSGARSADRTASQEAAGLRNVTSGTAKAYYMAANGSLSGSALATSEITDGSFSLTLPASITTVPSNLVVVVTAGAIQMRSFVSSTTSLLVTPISEYVVSSIVSSGEPLEYFSMNEFDTFYSEVEDSIISQSISFSTYTSVTAAVGALNVNTTLSSIISQQITAATMAEAVATVSPAAGLTDDVYVLTCTVSGGSYTTVQGRCDDTESWQTLTGDTLSCTYSGAGFYYPECRVDGQISDAVDEAVNVGFPTDVIVVQGTVMALDSILLARTAAVATSTMGLSYAAGYSVAIYGDYNNAKTMFATSTTDSGGDFILAMPESVTTLSGDYIIEATKGNDTIRSFIISTTDLIVSPESDYVVYEVLDSEYPLSTFTTAELANISSEVETLVLANEIDFMRYQTTLMAVQDIESEWPVSAKTSRLIEMAALPDLYGRDDSGLIPYISNADDDYGLFVMNAD